MARDFNGSSDFADYSSPVVTTTPFTVALWFRSDSQTTDQAIWGVGDTGVGNGDRYSLHATGDAPGDNISWIAKAGSPAIATTSTGYTAGVWHHVAAIAAASNDRTVYLDGGSSGTNTTSSSPSGLDITRIGSRASGTNASFFDGRIAEVCVWNEALNASEIASLARGKHPTKVRPKAIVMYNPLWGLSSPEQDLSGNNRTFTLTGTSAANHPPVEPFTGWTSVVDVPVAGGAIAGTADMVFGAGTSTLTGTGALAGTSDLTFAAGSSTLTGTGALAGSSALVFAEGSSTLTGAGALAGTSTLVFGAGSSTLLGAGALAGSAALVFGAGSSTLTGAGALAGTAALVFDVTGTLDLPSGSIAGTAALVFGAGTSTLTGAGALAGTAALVFDATGTLLQPSSISGTSAITFTPAGTLTGVGALAGTAALAFTVTATPVSTFNPTQFATILGRAGNTATLRGRAGSTTTLYGR